MAGRLKLAAVFLALLAIWGCSPETRYSVLSFFFDGVPQPGEEKSEGIAGRDRKSGARGLQVRARNHGPYAAKMCYACHQSGGGNKLILPVEKLCLNCHTLDLQKRKVHGPVVSGGCRVCHNPHGTGRPFMLVSESTVFCFYCHEEAEVRSHETHQAAGDMQCTECHNPHASDNDYLLK